ncbi:MAG: SIR2 family NAD-dependent protein deacylase [Beijerinckiaceae bacterium]
MPLPNSLDPASSLLFLGSGFSSIATNIANKNPPVGKGLAEEFEVQLGVGRGELDLKILANEMQFRKELNLYQTLYSLFTIASLAPEQLEILSRRWLRIFTTNYDDAIEFAYQKNGVRCPSFSYDDPIPRRIPTGTIVHIHGTIRKANENNVLDQLVLNENSYIRQHFEQSPWYAELDRALDHCSSCFFLGYSLSDYHIAALLLQKPTRKTKIFFIMRDMPNDIARRQIEQFGEIHPIGISGFADLCRTLPAPPPITDLRALRGVRYLDPFRDNRAIIPPTPSEILRLVTFGDFNPQRCLTNLPAATYVVPREEVAITAVAEVKQAKTLIVHSFLGNGKTIFIPILAHQLSTEGYKSFVCSSAGPEMSREIQALQSQEKVVIFFDSYDLAINMIAVFEELLPQAKYVVNVRTGLQEIRLHEIQEKMPDPVKRISLNGIKRKEKEIFKDLLDGAGLLGSKLAEQVEEGNDYREIVTTVYNHEGIRSQLASAIKPLLLDVHTKNVLITGLLLSWIGQRFEPALLRAVTERDPYVELRRHEAIAGEIFKLDDNDLEVRSSLFAEYVLRQHCAPDDLLEVIEKLIVVAVRRKRERGFQGILSKLMRVATLKTVIVGAKGLDTIENLFRNLQRDIDVNEEPLFWLQYAILESEMKNFAEAESFLETAYKRADKSINFQTFQIDTYALRLLLRIEELSNAREVARFEQIVEKSELVLSMVTDQNRRAHAIQVLEGFEPFVKARGSVMSISERNAMVFQLRRLEEALGGLSPEVRAETGSDTIKRSVAAARDYIVKLKQA